MVIKPKKQCTIFFSSHEFTVVFSSQAFKNHQLIDTLAEPGNSDLTSNVNFSQLRKVFTQSGGWFCSSNLSEICHFNSRFFLTVMKFLRR